MKNLAKIFLTLILLLSVIWIISFAVPKIIELYKTDNIEIKTEKIDTVVKQKVDTIWIREPHTVGTIKWRNVVDTLVTTKHDTVEVLMPLATKRYEGSEVTSDGSVEIAYRAYVSGHRASLDSIVFKVEHNDSIITKEVTKVIVKKKKGFKIAPYAGYGFNPIERKFSPSIGLAVTYVF